MQQWQIRVSLDSEQGKLAIVAVAGVERDEYHEFLREVASTLRLSGKPLLANLGDKIENKIPVERFSGPNLTRRLKERSDGKEQPPPA